MFVKLFGKVMEVSDVQPLNADTPMLVSFSGKVMVEMEAHSENA